MITMTTMAPKPINMGYSSPYLISGLVSRTLPGGSLARAGQRARLGAVPRRSPRQVPVRSGGCLRWLAPAPAAVSA
jgi:hypothetical protein